MSKLGITTGYPERTVSDQQAGPCPQNPMKTILSLLAFAGSFAAITTAAVEPAAAQWGSFGLSRQQIQFQRSNGWSSGDYFGLRSSAMNHTHLASTAGADHGNT